MPLQWPGMGLDVICKTLSNNNTRDITNQRIRQDENNHHIYMTSGSRVCDEYLSAAQ